MILFGIGGAVVLGGVALLASLSGGDADSADVAATSPVATAPTAPEESLTTVRRNMAASIDNWRDIKVKGGLKQLIGFEVATVEWMPTASPADKPRLAVTLSITNTSDAPLSYASWDSPGRNGAYLVDSDLQMVAAASGQRGNIDLQADETIAETLHFALTKQDYTELRLVLPYGAVKRTGQWGYILSRESLQGEPSIFTPAATSAAAEPVPQAPATVAAPLPEAAPQPIVIKPVSEPTVDDGEATEDIRDIVRKSTPTPASAAKE